MVIPVNKIPGIEFIAPSHRAYEYVLDFIVAAASVGKFLNAYHGQPVTTFAPDNASGLHQTIEFQGHASGKTVEFLPYDVLHGVFVAGTRTVPVPYLRKHAFSSIAGASTGAVAETYEGIQHKRCSLAIGKTTCRQSWQHTAKRSADSWPSVLRFGAIVRDTMSHGGAIHMFPAIPPARSLRPHVLAKR